MVKRVSIKKEVEILHRIADISTGTMDLSELLRQISRMIVTELGLDACLIYLHDDNSDSLVLSGSHNPKADLLGKLRLKMGEGVTGWVAVNKKPVAIPNKAYRDSRFKSFALLPEDKYESFLSVPVLLKNQLTGVINLHTKKPHVYSPSEIELLKTIAKQISGSIENARLYAENTRRARQIETLSQVSRLVAGQSYLDEILRLIVSVTAESLGLKIVSLMLLNDAKQELSIVATQSLSEDYRKKPPLKVSESLSGRAVHEKSAIAISDVTKEKEYKYPGIAKHEGLVSLLSVPLMVKEKCIGVLNCYTTELHKFTDMEKKMLTSVANQAAVAIENTRLVEEADSSREELESRKLIERAKGIIMQTNKVSEEEAFREMRKAAMDKRKSMKEIAEAILLSREIKTS